MPLNRLTALCLALTLARAAPAADPRPVSPRAAEGVTPELLAAIPAADRAAVAAVVNRPTLVARSEETPFLARPADYDFCTLRPDRASLAWRRLGVPCVPITEAGDNQFLWADDAGNKVTWRAVARFSDGVIWLAGGQIKPGSVLPAVPVQAVAILRCPRTDLAGEPGLATFEPAAAIYLQTDSRAASAFLRIAGPAAPRLAEQGAEQMLLFFSGPARYARQNPDQVAELFGPAKH